ncbi:MAG TPA: GNAT family N-acetyltransferase [bacterium]|nr:GNAT family N-acetyltransferase [bacterium]
MNWLVRTFEIGYWIRAAAQGRGYVAEAVRVLVRFAFEALGANRVEIRTGGGNARSRKVAEAWVCEGTLRARPHRWGRAGRRHRRLRL